MEKHSELHKEVVTGVVQVIKYLDGLPKNQGKCLVNFMELQNIGCDGKSAKARFFIFEFIKDGLINLGPEEIRDVRGGNYDGIWRTINEWLQHFGYSPVEPEPVGI